MKREAKPFNRRRDPPRGINRKEEEERRREGQTDTESPRYDGHNKKRTMMYIPPKHR
jgi:hypothetical protein